MKITTRITVNILAFTLGLAITMFSLSALAGPGHGLSSPPSLPGHPGCPVQESLPIYIKMQQLVEKKERLRNEGKDLSGVNLEIEVLRAIGYDCYARMLDLQAAWDQIIERAAQENQERPGQEP